MTNLSASAIGLATYSDDTLLDVWYPNPALSKKPHDVADLERGIRTDDISSDSYPINHYCYR